MKIDCPHIISKLKTMANPANVEGMAKFGINPYRTLGVSVVDLRKIARRIGMNHSIATKLWDSGIHEARILAALVDEPSRLTENQMEMWVRDFDSWDICDQVCSNLFDKSPIAYKKAVEWTKRKEEYVKRAGFVLMATLSVHDKFSPDQKFEEFFYMIKRESVDERNFVKKAINWALRQIGKRNRRLNQKAIALAKEIELMESPSAKWIAKDALRELTSEKVRSRLNFK